MEVLVPNGKELPSGVSKISRILLLGYFNPYKKPSNLIVNNSAKNQMIII
jgi:hypothetical protein